MNTSVNNWNLEPVRTVNIVNVAPPRTDTTSAYEFIQVGFRDDLGVQLFHILTLAAIEPIKLVHGKTIQHILCCHTIETPCTIHLQSGL